MTTWIKALARRKWGIKGEPFGDAYRREMDYCEWYFYNGLIAPHNKYICNLDNAPHNLAASSILKGGIEMKDGGASLNLVPGSSALKGAWRKTAGYYG